MRFMTLSGPTTMAKSTPSRSSDRMRSFAVALMCLTVLLCATVLAPASAVARTYTAMVIDGDTGEVLHEYRADHKVYPASLTKIMTLYMLFDALDHGKVSL